MPRITVGTENGAAIEIHYEDHGSGQPVVLIHGYPLNGDSWERQERVLLAAGYRVITLRPPRLRQSSQPTIGYDYDTFAADLNALLDHLELDDVVLAGFSMGTGEVTRYLGTYGSARVRKAVLLGAIPPFLLKTDDNPEGVDGEVFDGIKAAVVNDRYAYFKDFLDNFYNVDELAPQPDQRAGLAGELQRRRRRVAVRVLRLRRHLADDFRGDLPKIDVPTLVVHGTEDRILPFESTAEAAARPGREPEAGPGRGRPAQHRLDPSRGGQPGAARLPRPNCFSSSLEMSLKHHRRFDVSGGLVWQGIQSPTWSQVSVVSSQ